jgi:hypothetical protein
MMIPIIPKYDTNSLTVMVLVLLVFVLSILLVLLLLLLTIIMLPLLAGFGALGGQAWPARRDILVYRASSAKNKRPCFLSKGNLRFLRHTNNVHVMRLGGPLI